MHVQSRLDLQRRIAALSATLEQMERDALAPGLLCEAFYLFVDVPDVAFATDSDRHWWYAQLAGITQRHRLGD
jgi:hypothetical protein